MSECAEQELLVIGPG